MIPVFWDALHIDKGSHRSQPDGHGDEIRQSGFHFMAPAHEVMPHLMRAEYGQQADHIGKSTAPQRCQDTCGRVRDLPTGDIGHASKKNAEYRNYKK